MEIYIDPDNNNFIYTAKDIAEFLRHVGWNDEQVKYFLLDLINYWQIRDSEDELMESLILKNMKPIPFEK